MQGYGGEEERGQEGRGGVGWGAGDGSVGDQNRMKTLGLICKDCYYISE